MLVKEDAPFIRPRLQAVFEEADVQTRVVFAGNIMRQPGFKGIPRREDDAGYPNADRVMSGGLLLGFHQGMDEPELEYMADVFSTFAKSM